MKTIILENNIPDNKIVHFGLDLVKEQLSSIGFPFTFTTQIVDKEFTAIRTQNADNQTVTLIPPEQIFPFKGSNDCAVLVFDATKVIPSPSNPSDNGDIIQIPIQWFLSPQDFADFLLHEICHRLFFRSGLKDITHLMNHRDWDPGLYDRLNIGGRPLRFFYLYLVETLKPYWDVSVSQTTVLRFGSKGDKVKELQTLLGIKADGVFGPITKRIVIVFQLSQKLVGDGVVGDKTWAKLWAKPKLPLVDAIIKVESNGDLYAIGDKTLVDKAYGCMQIRKGVCTDVNKVYGTSYKPQDTLGNRELSIDLFNKYFTIYTDNKTDEQKARAWNGGGNYQKIYNKKGYANYSKQLDAYWEKVKKILLTA